MPVTRSGRNYQFKPVDLTIPKIEVNYSSDDATDAAPAALTVAEAKPFRLLGLPDELWVRIGKFAIDSSPAVESDGWDGRLPDIEEQPAITRTCRRLRAELLPYYYATKIDIVIKFRAWSPSNVWNLKMYNDHWLPLANEWLLAVGKENRMRMNGFHIKVDRCYKECMEMLAKLFAMEGIEVEWSFQAVGIEEKDWMQTREFGVHEVYVYRARFLG